MSWCQGCHYHWVTVSDPDIIKVAGTFDLVCQACGNYTNTLHIAPESLDVLQSHAPNDLADMAAAFIQLLGKTPDPR